MIQQIAARRPAAEGAARPDARPGRAGRKVLVASAVTLTAAITLTALAGCASRGTAATAAGPGPGPATTAVSMQGSFVGAIRRVLPSVVEIRTSTGSGPESCSTPEGTS